MIVISFRALFKKKMVCENIFLFFLASNETNAAASD
jgi:hypothetical protein